MNSSGSVQRARGTRWCSIGIGLALISVALIVIGLAGVRLELLSPIASFMLVGVSCLILILSGLLNGIGIAVSLGTAGDASAVLAWGALAIGAIVIGTALNQRPNIPEAPAIHDISTDTENPPLFDAILPLRADAPNPPEYAGGDVARQQETAYPDLHTLTINKPVDEVFPIAEQIARDFGWDIIAADQASGRIEATDTTTWFRFKDDIVIRLTPNEPGTNVDLRSKSRVGKSDLGANAVRIRAFLDQLKVRTAS